MKLELRKLIFILELRKLIFIIGYFGGMIMVIIGGLEIVNYNKYWGLILTCTGMVEMVISLFYLKLGEERNDQRKKKITA